MNYDNLVSKMLGEMSENEAIAVAKTQWWIDIGIVKAAWLQLHQRRPCMPPAEFHKGVELLLGRSVLIDEILSNQQALINEVLAGNSPSLHEIMLFMLSQLP